MADDRQEPRRHAVRAEKDPARVPVDPLTSASARSADGPGGPGGPGDIDGGSTRRVILPPHRPFRISSNQSKIATPSQTFHACDFCRKAKAKCSGDQPCVRCLSFGKQCVYGDGKRDKEKKQVACRSNIAAVLKSI
jgi:hypothetical protein